MHSAIARGQKLTVFGGRGFSGGKHTVLGTVSHFDLGTMAWSEPVQTAMLRCAHAAAPVSATSFAIFGGWSGTPDGIFNTVLIHDETSSEWTELTIKKKLGVEPRFAHSSCYKRPADVASDVGPTVIAEKSSEGVLASSSEAAAASSSSSSSPSSSSAKVDLACTLYAFGGMNSKQGLNDLVALSLEKSAGSAAQGGEGQVGDGEEGKGEGEGETAGV